ncbi:MAG: hypothetical protein H6828_09355 [Planctomycetes bacterium]|nr:hypothetical protein [Planctomycetota bacterium]
MSTKPRTPTRLAPRLLVAREVLRALLDLARLPWRLLEYWATRDAERAELLEDLTAVPELAPDVAALALPARPLRVFVACAEASGEIHAVNLVTALREVARAAGAPAPEVVGLGGPALAAAGVRVVGDPVSRSAMGFASVLGALPFYLGLVTRAARELKHGGHDLFLPVDSPALHVPLAHVARACAVRAVHFVTPQYWGWAPWRVGGYARAVDLALSILPFEPAWFARRGVRVAHVGHPLLDELGPPPPIAARAEVRRVVVLPGSRRGVIRRNLPTMLRALEAARAPGEALEVVVAQRDPTHRALLEGLLAELGATERVRLACGDLDAVLDASDLALSVSGTILVHLLHRRLPAVVVYRAEHARQMWMARELLTAPWFSSVNLLAGRELYPEFLFRDPAPAGDLVQAVSRGLHDAAWRADVREGLDAALARLGPAGATRRAALAALRPWSGAPRP